MTYILAAFFSILDLVQSIWHCANCLMLACIQYNSAMFYVFSGPLFANVQSYVYLDLIIWGIAPLIFIFLQPYLKRQFKRTQKNKRKRLILFIVWTICIWISYLFMNYSQSFNWNYFHRIFNLDFGYFLFDISNRMIGYIITLEDSSDAQKGKKCTQKNCGNFCHFKYAVVVFSYAIIFWFSVVFDINSQKAGQKVLSICSTFSCIITLLIPISYYFKHKKNLKGYTHLNDNNQQSEEIESKDNQAFIHGQDQSTLSPASYIEKLQHKQSRSQNSQSAQKQDLNNVQTRKFNSRTLGFYLIQGSLFINLNYFSLWIMESIKGQTDQFVQYNLTIVITSTFFLISTFIYYLFGHLPTFQQEKAINLSIFSEKLPKIKFSFYRIASFSYGIYLCCLYFLPKLQYGLYFGIALIGFQQIVNIKKYAQLQQLKMITDRTSLLSQIAVFFVVPLIFQVFKIGSTSLLVYALLSGIISCIGTILI